MRNGGVNSFVSGGVASVTVDVRALEISVLRAEAAEREERRGVYTGYGEVA